MNPEMGASRPDTGLEEAVERALSYLNSADLRLILSALPPRAEGRGDHEEGSYVISGEMLRKMRGFLELIVAAGRDERMVGPTQHASDLKRLVEAQGDAGKLLLDLHQWSLLRALPAGGLDREAIVRAICDATKPDGRTLDLSAAADTILAMIHGRSS